MTPVALAVAQFPAGPPSQVTFLPALWLLVPGALRLIVVTKIVGNPAAAGIEDLVKPLGSDRLDRARRAVRRLGVPGARERAVAAVR